LFQSNQHLSCNQRRKDTDPPDLFSIDYCPIAASTYPRYLLSLLDLDTYTNQNTTREYTNQNTNTDTQHVVLYVDFQFEYNLQNMVLKRNYMYKVMNSPGWVGIDKKSIIPTANRSPTLVKLLSYYAFSPCPMWTSNYVSRLTPNLA